jgi:hypothetical protein
MGEVRRYEWDDFCGHYVEIDGTEDYCTVDVVVDAADYDALAAELDAARAALEAATAELRNIAEAKRFDRERFDDDTTFADWAQSRARHRLAALTTPSEGAR